MADNFNPSREEKILRSIIDNTEYTGEHPSRIENLLLELGSVLNSKADLDQDGLVPTSQLPPQVFEHMVEVQDDTARYTLTPEDVQNGDYVYVDSSQIMYFVIDDTKLDREAGYKPVSAGIAAKAVGDKNGNDIAETYQTFISSTHKLSADLVDDSNATNKFVSSAEKTSIGTSETKLTGVSSTTISTPAAASKARILRPSRPIIRPLTSSLSIWKTLTEFSIAVSVATRWIV